MSEQAERSVTPLLRGFLMRMYAPPPWDLLLAEWERSLRAENESPRTIEGYTTWADRFHDWTPPNRMRPDIRSR